MRIIISILLILTINGANAQQLNIGYRTAAESNQKLHYLVFMDKSNCKLKFPPQNHGDAMFPQTRDYVFKYRVDNDTITFYGISADSTNLTLDRILKSKFTVTDDKTLFDCISGYTYVNKDLVSDKYTIYAIDGKVFKQKATEMDGYGLVRKNFKMNSKIKRKVKDLNEDTHTVNILIGKEAYDKYGLIGMNGVIEIEKKE